MTAQGKTPQGKIRIEALAGEHDRAAFSSGVEALDTFLHRYARQNEQRGVGRTFVAVDEATGALVGYYTLSASSVRFEHLPDAAARRLPHYPVPVVHLGRLAVAARAQGRGLGGALLYDALARALRVSGEIGLYAVEVIAKDEAARRFYEHHGFHGLEDDPLHLYLPMETVRALVGGEKGVTGER